MHEMLGNQLFLARKIIQKQPKNLEIAFFPGTLTTKPFNEKLIICYTQTGQVQKALDAFIDLMKKDISFIVDTDPLDDDCPCPELVFTMEKKLSTQQDSLDYHIILGILYLYCDVAKSLHFFQTARELDPQNTKIHWIIKMISNYQKQKTYH